MRWLFLRRFFHSRRKCSDFFSRLCPDEDWFIICTRIILVAGEHVASSWRIPRAAAGLVLALWLAFYHLCTLPFYRWAVNALRMAIFVAGIMFSAAAWWVSAGHVEEGTIGIFLAVLVVPLILTSWFGMRMRLLWLFSRVIPAIVSQSSAQRASARNIGISGGGGQGEKRTATDLIRFYAPCEVELSTRFMDLDSSPDAVRLAAAIYHAGMVKYQLSAKVFLDYATFMMDFFGETDSVGTVLKETTHFHKTISETVMSSLREVSGVFFPCLT